MFVVNIINDQNFTVLVSKRYKSTFTLTFKDFEL